jgi:hypothetical protein
MGPTLDSRGGLNSHLQIGESRGRRVGFALSAPRWRGLRCKPHCHGHAKRLPHEAALAIVGCIEVVPPIAGVWVFPHDLPPCIFFQPGESSIENFLISFFASLQNGFV